MARGCEVCGKIRQVGYSVSHAHNKTKRVFRPNLQVVRVTINGSTHRMKVCTRCLRSGKVAKAS